MQKRVVLQERKGRLQRLSQAVLTQKQLALVGFKNRSKHPIFRAKESNSLF